MALPNVGTDKSMEVALATKMQLVLDQPMSDMNTKLCNRNFEGDFFKIGDTVAIVKPDVDSVKIELGNLDTGHDDKLACAELKFSKTKMQIDKFAKYAFIISDVTKAEGKWNYESGNLDLTAQEIRKAHNLETAQIVIDAAVGGTIAKIGTPESPLVLANADELYEKVLVPMHSALYEAGAITADGQITYGANPEVAKQLQAGIFLPTKAYNQFLTSKYFTDRATTKADDAIATGDVAKVLGLGVAVEPALDPQANIRRKVTITGNGGQVVAIVAGTANTVTVAGKVLPPEKQRSQTRFADEYHGMEIYGKEVAEAKAAVVAFVQLPA